MIILDVKRIPREELIARLRDVRLKGHNQEQVYRNASITILNKSTNDLWPAQKYVIATQVANILKMRDEVLEYTEGRDDIFLLDGGLWVTLQYDTVVGAGEGAVAEGEPIPVTRTEVIPVLPPIVEFSEEAAANIGWGDKPYAPTSLAINLINDGMHRCFAARWAGHCINVAYVIGASRPYYAYPLERKWMGVEMVESAPPSGDGRKNYREPEDHKALFRDFNAVFPGVQKKR